MASTSVSSDPTADTAANPASGKLSLFVVTLIVVALAELIGIVRFKLGPGQVILQPMVWALLLAAAYGLAWRRLPAFASIPPRLQSYAGHLLNAGLLLFIIKLGLTVGSALPEVRKAGWALLFQEFGHTFGTLALGLPLALLLGIKREAVGATFSIGREGNLVIIGEKYGMASAEGRGVLAEYITGTVLGALFIAVLAGFVTSLNIFDPRSLAMGAGVGSGSMMAAAIGAITAQQPAAMAPTLNAIGAASNLLTAVAGFYFTLFLALPVNNWLYYKLEPVLGRFSKRKSEEAPSLAEAGEIEGGKHGFADDLLAWLLVSCGVIIGNYLSYKVAPGTTLIGLVIMVAIAFVVHFVKLALPMIPQVLILSVVATAVGVPGLLPFSDWLIDATNKVNFLTFTTPVLALAGFSVAKDLPIFRKLGWRIVLVSLTAAAGTFLGATVIAEIFHIQH
ncbi:MAG TPA: DUF3100 domain-containing protein [Rhodoblastus sp.]|nr:DUF3100 domain-containing protein [Rhodoblastus sp.]